jgi:lactoylglutathione lyase
MKFNALVPELLVSNIKETLRFYVDLLGFEINYARKEDDFYFIERQGAQIMLEPLEENTPYTPICSQQNLLAGV